MRICGVSCGEEGIILPISFMRLGVHCQSPELRQAGEGTVFEIAKTAHGYASTPTTVVSFNGADGTEPRGSLFADA